jgi:hypothetical protein
MGGCRTVDHEPIAACRQAAELLDALADALERDAGPEHVDDAVNAVAAALEKVGRLFPPIVH